MFGAEYPIVLAPMGGVGTPELAAAVCNAGGHGSLAGAYLSPSRITEEIARLRALTSRPFSVNLFMQRIAPLNSDPAKVLSVLAGYHAELGLDAPHIPPVPAENVDAQIAAVLASRPPMFTFTFGIPAAEVINAFRHAGTRVAGTATTVEEAAELEKAGLDAIILQGAEAGAHRGTFIGRVEDAMIPIGDLLARSLSAVKIPLIAAGGVREGKDIARLLNGGAAAVQIGTAFIPCPESSAPEVYKERLLAGVAPGDTVITRAFSGRAARGIPNRLIEDMERIGDAILPFPWQNAATRPVRNAAAQLGRSEYLSLWAGEGTGPIRRMPARELMKVLIAEASLQPA